MIDNNITITVLRIYEDKVALGIVAPEHIPLRRKEVDTLIQGFHTDDEFTSNS